MNILLATRGSRGYVHNSEMSGDGFLKSVIGPGRIRYGEGLEMLNTGFEMPASPFLQATFWAFSQHIPLRIEPAFFWMTVLQEVATMVKIDPYRFAHVFNSDPANKELVKVICDELSEGDQHWPLAIGRFRSALSEKTGADLVEGFFPHFSDDNETRELAYLVGVMDAASPFFKYEVWTRCGIPEIRLEGTTEDWSSLYQRVSWLEQTFGPCEYFTRVKALIDQINAQVKNQRPDTRFWESIFKYQSGSGGDSVTGWITDLYAHQYTDKGPVAKSRWYPQMHEYDGYKLNLFPSGLSVVPFVWVLYGERYPMRFFSGFTGIEMKDGALAPVIGFGVVEGEK